MKTVLKDAQVSLRLSSDVAEQLKRCAAEENLSLADYVTKIFKERQNKDDLSERVKALERAVFQQSAA
jgi:predicted DNA-binding ribbon-helix-helix protein